MQLLKPFYHFGYEACVTRIIFYQQYFYFILRHGLKFYAAIPARSSGIFFWSFISVFLMVKKKVQRLPGSDSNQILPPSVSTPRLTVAKPIPVLFISGLCLKVLNIWNT